MSEALPLMDNEKKELLKHFSAYQECVEGLLMCSEKT